MVKDFDYHVDGVKRKATGGKVYLVEHLSTMSTDERKEMGRWLEEHHMPFSHKNQAIYWRTRHPEINLSQELVDKDGWIQLEDPAKQIAVRYQDLESIVLESDVKTLKTLRLKYILDRHGKIALDVFDQLLREKIEAGGDRDE